MGSGTCSTVPCWTAGWCQRKGQSAHRQQIVCCWSPLKLLQWRVVAERSSALDSSSGVVRMWVRIPAWPVAALASLSKTLNHNCFVLRMGRKAVGPVCCVMHVKEPRTLTVKIIIIIIIIIIMDTYIAPEREGACPGVSGFILLLVLALLDV